MAIEDYFVSCVKKRPLTTLNTYGKPVSTYTDTPALGYLGSVSSALTSEAGALTLISKFKFYSDDFDWQVGDLVEYEDFTYIIVSPPKNTAHRDHHCKLEVKEFKNVTNSN